MAGEIFLPLIFIILIGFCMKKRLPENAGATLSRIILNITLPALVITSMSTVSITITHLLITKIAVVHGLIMFGIAKLLYCQSNNTKPVLAISLLGFNIGQFAYPFIERMWGAEGLSYLIMFDIGNAIIVFGLSYYLAGSMSRIGDWNLSATVKKLATFIPLQSYLIALLIAVSNLQLPQLIQDILTPLAAANGGLVMLLIGFYLDFSKLKVKSVWKLVGVRYAVGLTMGVTLFLFFPGSLLLGQVLLVVFVLPVAMSVIPYSIEFKHDTSLAGAAVNVSIVLSIALLWILFALF
ncbi:hypothetical protein PRVXH_002459 [Proteinivorax hydrogeniformans]|uniref:AEC family transporter n=1 Tax=Proteinivorax hydrogeniformans TaxID=1826727 RepID=A0AAU8HTE9_9FIRM